MSKFTETVLKGSSDGSIVESRSVVLDAESLGPDQVHIRITHCGLCATDLHFTKKDMVLGHEPVGVVSAIGASVSKVSVGDVVGWGYLHDSCNHCEFCWTGREVLCPQRQFYGYADYHFGGFSTGAVLKESYIYKIPAAISPANAAVLQCAGATVFSAIYNNDIKPTHRVGVVGIGGLGHLALQFLKAWGCHVTAFSTSDSKKEEAMSFGAHEFVVTKLPEGEAFKCEEKLDFILSTVSGQLPWGQYTKVLKPSGAIIVMGLSDEPDMKIPYGGMISYEHRIHGSLVASRQVQTLMLDFAARHNIQAAIEKVDMTRDNLENCCKRLKNNDVRYRFVLEQKSAANGH